ncbi:MAG: hypothetical protein M0D57_08055 [Sphingobacteriales bacterium JAD_PAG50586_3]|nr:MAG: hypothetical protein M0D57_08055 [Sphingobacteriales bacterium JAD_PAG50586_3]
MRKLLLLFLTIIGSAVYAQNKIGLYNTIAELKLQGIDTFIVYNKTTINRAALPPTAECSIDENRVFFLYYILKGNTSLVRVDNCYTYQPVVNLQSAFVKQFSSNLKKVDAEIVRPYTYAKPSEKKKKKWERINVTAKQSTCYELTYITPTDTIHAVYDGFDTLPQADNTLPNENYKYNSSTWTVKLAAMAATEVQGFTFMLKGN